MTEDLSYHQAQIKRHCRVCARVMSKKEYKYSCEQNKDILMTSGVDVSKDQLNIHPTTFCGSCRTKAKRYHDAKQVNCTLNIYKWTEHTDSSCSVCMMFRSQQSMGRPTTSNKIGRPCAGSSQSVANNILRKSPPSNESRQSTFSCPLFAIKYCPSF